MSPEATRTSCAFHPVPSYQAPWAARSSFLSLAPPDPCVGSPATDDSARGWVGGGAALSQERPLRFGAGEAAKRRDSGKGEKQQPERKQSCGVTQQEEEEEGREEAERKRGRERETRDRSFQGSSKSASGASEGPRSVPHRRARAAHRPGAPREALLSGTTSTQVYGRRRKKLRSNPLPGQNG